MVKLSSSVKGEDSSGEEAKAEAGKERNQKIGWHFSIFLKFSPIY
jgi:hypothetical protein